MEPVSFFKMNGSGNDFIIIDNRNGVIDVDDLPAFIRRVCRRKMSVGADGFILIESTVKADLSGVFTIRTAAKPKCAATAHVVAPGLPL